MFIKNIAVVTSIAYQFPNEVRFQMFLRTLKELAKYELTTFTADISSLDVHAKIKQSPYLQIINTKGQSMGASRRTAMCHAIDHVGHNGYIFWMEPEKYDLVKDIKPLIEFLVKKKGDLVNPRRTKKSWLTYPEFQHRTEKYGNEFWRVITGQKPPDIYFGPVGFRADPNISTPFIDKCNGELWEHHIIPRLELWTKGAKLLNMDVDFSYPDAQRQEEENNPFFTKKRLEQLNRVTGALQNWAVKHECL